MIHQIFNVTLKENNVSLRLSLLNSFLYPCCQVKYKPPASRASWYLASEARKLTLPSPCGCWCLGLQTTNPASSGVVKPLRGWRTLLVKKGLKSLQEGLLVLQRGLLQRSGSLCLFSYTHFSSCLRVLVCHRGRLHSGSAKRIHPWGHRRPSLPGESRKRDSDGWGGWGRANFTGEFYSIIKRSEPSRCDIRNI